ncbi:MAG: M15 family metallopeptidase [Bacteroidetes bacterium]|nr:M15 family metallopeptidase [Bacteroidota bacterium]
MRLIVLGAILLGLACGQAGNPKVTTVDPAQPLPDAVFQEPVSDFDMTGWTDLSQKAPFIKQDIRYATANNFTGKVLYPCGRCLLRNAVASALIKVGEKLEEKGYGLMVFDCYRPLDVQWLMWETTPDKRYVSDPNKGSMHNRGTAVDLTLTDPAGNELDMGTAYDFFGKKAWPEYMDLPAAILERRTVLREAMLEQGFQSIRTEWWHYSFPGTGSPISEAVWPCR